MSLYLKVLPAVLLDPDILLQLGQRICSIVRTTLILDRRMEEICTAIEREGRTLKEVIERRSISACVTCIEEAFLNCERAYSLLKAGIQLNLLHSDKTRSEKASLLHSTLTAQGKMLKRARFQSGDRFLEIIRILQSEEMQQALILTDLSTFCSDLQEAYEKFTAVQDEFNFIDKAEPLPTLKSTIALYGMLVDTLIANVRFENYQLLHRVESVLCHIEEAIAEATDAMTHRKRSAYEPFTIASEPVSAMA